MHDLKCENCPAIKLRTAERISKLSFWMERRNRELENMQQLNCIILRRELPEYHYFYLIDSKENWFRKSFKVELKQKLNDIDFLAYLRKIGVLYVNCAHCRLIDLGINCDADEMSQKIDRAARICLKNNNSELFKLYPNVPIISLFSLPSINLLVDFPEISKNVVTNIKCTKSGKYPGLLKHLNKALNKK